MRSISEAIQLPAPNSSSLSLKARLTLAALLATKYATLTSCNCIQVADASAWAMLQACAGAGVTSRWCVVSLQGPDSLRHSSREWVDSCGLPTSIITAPHLKSSSRVTSVVGTHWTTQDPPHMIHETGTDATDPIPYMMTSLVMIQYDKIAFEVHLQYTPILKFVFI